MGKKRKQVPELERMVREKRKKYVRYEEGAQLYSKGLHTFQQLAKEAGAIYRIKRIVLVNLDILDEYMEAFREYDF